MAFAAIALPVAPGSSGWWDVASDLHGEFPEMIGSPELVRMVADVYTSIPEAERERTVLIMGDYGEAGAIEVYGSALGLPAAISGMNSDWLRGCGDPPPTSVIVLDSDSHRPASITGTCEMAGRVKNAFGILNEEPEDHPWICLCREHARPWPEVWPRLKDFG